MRLNLSLIILVITFFGCTNVLEIDIALEKPLISVNAIFTPDSTWQVSATRSRDILDDISGSYFEPVDDAIVTLKDNSGNLIETLNYSFYNFNYMYRGITKPQIGQTYFLQIEIDNRLILQAENYIPLPVQIDSVQVDSSALRAGRNEIKISTFFIDPGEVSNFYAVKILRDAYYLVNDDTIRFVEDVRFEPFDPAFQDYFSTGTSTVFNDKFFSGKSYNFQCEVNPNFSLGTTYQIRIILLTVTEEYFEYFTTKNLQDSKREDPFAQPVQVFSNINNGVGIFVGFSSSSFVL